MEFVLGIGALCLCILLIIQELECESEVQEAYRKGYNDGLYQNVVKISGE